jgi:pimeloyl-ACP methyl ester carboxylesterase
MFIRRAPALLILALPLLTAGCYRPKPATVPLRALQMAQGKPDASCLVVFLPGRGDGPEDYVEHGFPEALRRAGSPCAMVGVDSHLGYYAEKSIVTRLHDDVIAPARARGVREVWLVGISLGGLGGLLYTREHPGEVSGLILLAPYLGEDDLIQEVKDAGGLAAFAPPPSPQQQTGDKSDFRSLWLFLKGYEKLDPKLPPLYLGYGRSDRFAAPNGLLGAVLPPGHVRTADGGHTWRTWRKLWDGFLAGGTVPGRASSKAVTPPSPGSAGRG